MRAVLQRVARASVSVEGETVARIGRGLAILLGVGSGDRPEDGERLAAKIAGLRLFADERGRMHQAVADVSGSILVIPQFTLYADVRHGRRPDFAAAAPPERSEQLFRAFCGSLRAHDLTVELGRFGAHMVIELVADGPVTVIATTDGWDEGNLGAKRPSA